VQAQGVADIVEADGVGQLSVEQAHHMTPWRERKQTKQSTESQKIEQAHHMTPWRERPGAFDDPSLPRQFGHQMRWNKIAELMQEREAAARWLVRCGFIHPLPCGRFTRGKPTLFYPSTGKLTGLL
jgi:hypothetical protein